MRPSSERTIFGAVFGLVMLLGLAVLLPLAMFKWIGDALAPQMMESVSYQLGSYMAGVSTPILEGLRGALEGLALLAAVLYLCYLLRPLVRSVLRRAKVRSSERSGKVYLKSHRKAA